MQATRLQLALALAALRQCRIMRHQYQCSALFAVQLEQQVADMLAIGMVEAAGGLVGKQQAWTLRKGARQGDTLLLATGQLRREVVLAFAQADALEPLPRFAFGIDIAKQLQRQHHILDSGQVADQVKCLEHETAQRATFCRTAVLIQAAERSAIKEYRALAGNIQPGQQTKQCRLATAGRPGDRHAFTRLYLKVNIIQYAQDTFGAGRAFADATGVEKRRILHA